MTDERKHTSHASSIYVADYVNLSKRDVLFFVVVFFVVTRINNVATTQ